VSPYDDNRLPAVEIRATSYRVAPRKIVRSAGEYLAAPPLVLTLAVTQLPDQQAEQEVQASWETRSEYML